MIQNVPFTRLYDQAIANGIADPIVLVFRLADPYGLAMAREFYGDRWRDDYLEGDLLSVVGRIGELPLRIKDVPDTIPIVLFNNGKNTVSHVKPRRAVEC